MVELAKRISSDWIALKEKLNDLYTLIDQLSIGADDLRAEVEQLRLSVEQGILEYKRTRLTPVLSGLETARFRTLALEEMAGHERALSMLLLTMLVQRLIALELLAPQKPPDEQPTFGVEGMQVNVILSDVSSRVKAKPALRSHPAVKNILVQVQRYNRENHKMRELLPTIRSEMRPAFLGNFTRTFNEITASIRRHYLALLREQEASERTGRTAFSLSLVPLRGLAPLLVNQSREIARMRSTLAFARGDKYKTREVLVALYESRHDAIRLIEQERAACAEACARVPQFGTEACLTGVFSGFRDEILAIYERQGQRDDL